MSRRLLAVLSSAVFCVGLFATGCAPELDSAGPGQECTTDEDCNSGLICSERRCVTASNSETDVGLDDTDGDESDIEESNSENNAERNSESHVDCSPGETRCESDETIERCIAPDGDDPYWTASNCPSGHICDDGRCLDESDDSADCCPGGCGDGEICHECSCRAYDPDQCSFQDQPCSTQGQISNDFVCSPLPGTDELRCRGLCDPGADAPDQTCPEDGTICQFRSTDQTNGHCLSNCSIGDNCADEWMTCIYNDAAFDDGICQPQTDTLEFGEACDPEELFSCAGEGICVGGFCRQSCRPFGQDQTDCATGYCLPFDGNWGFCAQDSSLDDDECSAPFSTCGEDATGCFEETPDDPQSPDYVCRDMCRLQLGDEDCTGGQTCHQYDGNNDVIGSCVSD